jgi:hypothetical protein
MDWTEINSFDQIDINKFNTLIICDIDDTLLYFPGLGPNKYNQIFQYYSQIYLESEIATISTCNFWNNLLENTEPVHTDIAGFSSLLLNSYLYNNEICFLTARPGYSSNIEFTSNNFKSINLDYNKFKVYYSHTIPKGEFIQSNIDLSRYTNIIFIDDLEHNLLNVKSIFGNKIQCYKFVHGYHN